MSNKTAHRSPKSVNVNALHARLPIIDYNHLIQQFSNTDSLKGKWNMKKDETVNPYLS
jgi:hypothetical protein